jgi:hypothetical protein
MCDGEGREASFFLNNDTDEIKRISFLFYLFCVSVDSVIFFKRVNIIIVYAVHTFYQTSSTSHNLKIHLQSNRRFLFLHFLSNFLFRSLRPLDDLLHQCLLLSTQPQNNTSKRTSIITS